MSPELEALIAEARDPNTSWVRLVELQEHPEQEVRRAIVDNKNLCRVNEENKIETILMERLAVEFWQEISDHPLFVLFAIIEPKQEISWVFREIVERTSDMGLVQHALKAFNFWTMRESISLNPNLSEEIIRSLIKSEEAVFPDITRMNLAKNPKVPEDVLRTLGNELTERSWTVRQVVARNSKTPEDVLRILGNEKTEPEGRVRQAVTENPNTPKDLLRTLANPNTESKRIVREDAEIALAARGLT